MEADFGFTSVVTVVRSGFHGSALTIAGGNWA